MARRCDTIGWEILPYEGLGPLRLMQSRRETRTILDSDVQAHYPLLDRNYDAYLGLGLKLYFDKKNRLEEIFVELPLKPLWQGHYFIGRRLDDVLNDLQKQAYEGKWDQHNIAYYLPQIGFCLFCANGEIIGIWLGSRDFYEKRWQAGNSELPMRESE